MPSYDRSTRQVVNRQPGLPDPRVQPHGHSAPWDGGALAGGSGGYSGGAGGGGGGGGSTTVSVTDGTTTVAAAASIDFTGGATVTNLGGGVAGVSVAGGTSLDWLSVTDYGAVGDGTTDDTAAITAAVAAADARGGGTVYFPVPSAYYKITSLITLTGRNYALVGGGPAYGPARVHQATANTGALKLAPSSGTASRDHTSLVRGLVVSGAGGAGSSAGVGIEATNDVHIEDCYVSGFFMGVLVHTASYYSHMTGSTVTNCLYGLDLDGTNNFTLDTCRFTGQWGSGTGLIGALTWPVWIDGASNLATRIVNCSVEYFTGSGVYVVGQVNALTVSGCYFETQQSSTGNAHVNLHNTSVDVLIEGCYLQGDGTAGFQAIMGGNATDRVTVQGCYFGLNSAIGIDAAASTNHNWLLVNNYNYPAGTFSLPATSYTLDPANPPGSGTVTSVGLTLPAELTVTGSPVTGSGTLAVGKASQSANLVWAGPVSGSAAAPAFRALVAADLPSTPATGEILISDTPSTPLVFADLLQNDAQTDLVYAG